MKPPTPDGMSYENILIGAQQGDAFAIGAIVKFFETLAADMGVTTLEPYVSGVGDIIWVHERQPSCDHGCVVHAPTEHVMREFPTHWREDRALMERICSHGVGHPDPDHITFVRRTEGIEAAVVEAVHGCCGCCREEG